MLMNDVQASQTLSFANKIMDGYNDLKPVVNEAETAALHLLPMEGLTEERGVLLINSRKLLGNREGLFSVLH